MGSDHMGFTAPKQGRLENEFIARCEKAQTAQPAPAGAFEREAAGYESHETFADLRRAKECAAGGPRNRQQPRIGIVRLKQFAVKPHGIEIAIDRANRLPTWRDQAGVLGVRLNLLNDRAKWLTDGTADWFWPAAEKAGLPVMFLTTGQTALFGRIAERHPQLTLIIDHMGLNSSSRANRVTESVPAAIDQAVALAKYPNVSVKLSGAVGNSLERYPFRDMTVYLQRLFDAYGPQRCHWGTDITNSLATASYRQRVTHFTEELSFLSESDKDWVMGRAILARLKWA